MAFHGYKSPSGGSPDSGILSAGQVRASVPTAPGEDGWLYALGARLGRPDPSSPTAGLAVYRTSSGNPSSQAGRTASFTVTTFMSSGSEGAEFTRDLVTACQIYDGTRVAYAVLGTGQRLMHGMTQANNLPAGANALFYTRTGLSQPPPDPLGYTGTSVEGWLAVWGVYLPNAVPLAPTTVTPGSTNPNTPTQLGAGALVVTGNFAASDETLPNGLAGDAMKRYRVQVINSDGSLYWDSQPTNATSTEIANRVFTDTYDGPALVPGAVYKIRCSVADKFDAWSPWSDYRYVTSGGGSVDAAAGTPTGKQETTTPGPYTATWRHTGGLATNAVQVRIVDADTGSALQTSATLSIAVNPNALISVTWATTGFAPLAWDGNALRWEIRGRDTGNNWSEWAGRSFTVDAAPPVPALQVPAAGATVTTPPRLEATCTDLDDTPATGLAVTFRIRNPAPILNPTFATDASGWTQVTAAGITATLTRDAAQSSDATGGSGRLQITANTGGVDTGPIARSDTFTPCVPGETYSFTMAVRTSAANLHPRVQFRWFDAGQVATGSATENDWVPTINAWSSRSHSAVAPAGAVFYKVGVYAEDQVGGTLGSVWWDAYVGDSSTRFARAGTFDAASGRWRYQATATDFPAFGPFTWDAYAFDGSIYSGSGATAADATKSIARALTYAQGPVVTLTAPLDGGTITTNTATISWTVTGSAQTKRQVLVYRMPARTLLHDSGNTSTTATTYQLPATLSGGEDLHEGDALEIDVLVTDAASLVGTAIADVTLDYPTPPSLQPTAILEFARGDLTPSIVKVSWPASAYPVGQFRYYRLTRQISADARAANPALPADVVNFGRIASIGQTEYRDHTVRAGVEYVYSLKQFVQVGADKLGSVTASTSIDVEFEATIVHFVTDPDATRVVFDAREDRTITTVLDFAVVSPWNQARPVQFESDVAYDEVETEFVLVARTPADANYDLWTLKRQIREAGILCYRDGRGNCLFGRWSSGPVVRDPAGGRLRRVRATFRELAYDESAAED